MAEIVFLFGHRQQHGKNVTVKCLENYLISKNKSYVTTSFAKKLKKVCADKYNLDYEKMEDNTYKMWCPPWLEKKVIYWDTQSNKEVPHWVFMDPGVLKIELKVRDRTVRDVLIDESAGTRKIWNNIWVHSAYKELYEAQTEIGIISDLRYPNEYAFLKENPNLSYVPKKAVKVLVHRPNGIFKNDGADNLLPDIDENFWDYAIINNDSETWKEDLNKQVIDMARNYGL